MLDLKLQLHLQKHTQLKLAVLAILAEVTAKFRKLEFDFDLVKELGIVANAMEALCDSKEEMEAIAREYLSVTTQLLLHRPFH